MDDDTRTLMYGANAEHGDTKAIEQDLDVIFGSKSALIKIDGKIIEVPTFAYVRQMVKELEEVRRKLVRVESQNRALRAHLDRQNRVAEGLKTEMDNKLDIR